MCSNEKSPLREEIRRCFEQFGDPEFLYLSFIVRRWRSPIRTAKASVFLSTVMVEEREGEESERIWPFSPTKISLSLLLSRYSLAKKGRIVHFQKYLKKYRFGDSQIHTEQWYKRKRRIVRVVVASLSHECARYCHHKQQREECIRS